MSPECIEQIRDCYVNKRELSLMQIAEMFNIQEHNISHLVRKHNWPKRGKNNHRQHYSRDLQLTDQQVQKIGEMYTEGYKVEDICARFGLNGENFRKLRKHQGWPVRSRTRQPDRRFEFVEDIV